MNEGLYRVEVTERVFYQVWVRAESPAAAGAEAVDVLARLHEDGTHTQFVVGYDSEATEALPDPDVRLKPLTERVLGL